MPFYRLPNGGTLLIGVQLQSLPKAGLGGVISGTVLFGFANSLIVPLSTLVLFAQISWTSIYFWLLYTQRLRFILQPFSISDLEEAGIIPVSLVLYAGVAAILYLPIGMIGWLGRIQTVQKTGLDVRAGASLVFHLASLYSGLAMAVSALMYTYFLGAPLLWEMFSLFAIGFSVIHLVSLVRCIK